MIQLSWIKNRSFALKSVDALRRSAAFLPVTANRNGILFAPCRMCFCGYSVFLIAAAFRFIILSAAKNLYLPHKKSDTFAFFLRGILPCLPLTKEAASSLAVDVEERDTKENGISRRPASLNKITHDAYQPVILSAAKNLFPVPARHRHPFLPLTR